MQIRAENDPRYFRRFLFMGIGLFGLALWFLYDAVYTYPAGRAQGFEDFKNGDKAYFNDDHKKAMTVDQFEVVAEHEKRLQWEKFSHDGEIKGTADITLQYVLAAASALVGSFLISLPLRARGRWVEADDNGVKSSWGQSFKFDEIEAVNKRQWRKKGIAKITYVADDRRNTFVIDDYKFDRYSMDAILYQLEQRIDPGRIANGPPEPEPEAGGPVAQAIQAGGRSPGDPTPKAR